MSSSSSSSFVSAMDNLNDENNEHNDTIKILDDETREADLSDHLSPGIDPCSRSSPYMPCGHDLDARNLIVCIDGDLDTFNVQNTNVIELYNLISKKVGDNQRTWYNSGIGTHARPSWKFFNFYKKVLYQKTDLAWDFERTVLDAYRWLSDNYEEDDRIFLFGFSRGAFQVRALSAMIEKVGLVSRRNELQIPFAYELYVEGSSRMAGHFKQTFSNRNLKVHFVGAWDTVSSSVNARGKSMLPGIVNGMTHVCYFRHALALDEGRVEFLPVYAYGRSAKPVKPKGKTREEPSQTKEVWFPGTHSDIGGRNVESQRMDRSRPPLRWMVFEAGAAGLRTAPFPRDLMEEEGSLETTRWPRRRKGRKIRPGQNIHSSLVRANGSTAAYYTPKARPPDDDPLFWETLLDRCQLEFGLYEHSRRAVNTLITDRDGDALKHLYHAFISRDARQAVYENVINALHAEVLTLDIKYLLLDTTVQHLKRSSRDDFDLNLKPLREILPLLSDLLCCRNTEYQRTAWDFLILFTNFVKVVELKEDHSSAFAMSPNGTRIASGSLYGTLRILNAETGTAVGRPLEGHRDIVTSVAFSPGGGRIVSGSDDRTVRIWDAKNGNTLGQPSQGHSDGVTSVAFSPDGTRIVSGSDDRTVRIWDAKTGSPVGEPLHGHSHSVLSVAFSPDGTRIVSGSADRTVRIWHAETASSTMGEALLLVGHNNWVSSVAFSPDGTRIVSGSYDRTVRIWDAENGNMLGQPSRGHSDGVRSVAFSPDGTRIVSGSDDRTVRIWDAKTGNPVAKPLQGHREPVLFVVFSRDRTCVTSVSHDGTVRICDMWRR